ncbi:MAG TPA: carboxypeptidase-like regulatory domain-containing protein, partial [Candidatus Acidoferrales bacterium]|nr:carboxypeptidase-like regulatory domain-containing protein [Candidatus Acidoferrales bacterium]
MGLRRFLIGTLVMLLMATPSQGSIFGTVRGIVHDPQHRPIEGAGVTLRAQASDWTRGAQTNADGEFTIDAVPIGDYTIRIEHPAFRTVKRTVVVASGSAPILHFPMRLGAVEEKVEVSAGLDSANPESTATESFVNRRQIERTPGASRTNSLAMITDFVPGAFIVHDQLHIRGGHQVSWLV